MIADKWLNGFGWIRGRIRLRTTPHAVQRFQQRTNATASEFDAVSAILQEIVAGRIVGKKTLQEWCDRGVFVGNDRRDNDMFVESQCKTRIYVLRINGSTLSVITVLTGSLSVIEDRDTTKIPEPYVDPNQPELRNITDDVRSQSNFVDFTNKEFGDAIVIGKSVEPHAWVCQCWCGTYFERKSKSIREGIGKASGDGRDRCPDCNYNLQVGKCEFKKQHGRWPDDDELLKLARGQLKVQKCKVT